MYDENFSGDRSVSALARLAAEIRHHERRVLEMVSQVSPADEVPRLGSNRRQPTRGGTGTVSATRPGWNLRPGAGGGVMPRQNPALMSQSSRYGLGLACRLGLVYWRLLDRERDLRKRFGVVGQRRRPRHLLDALEAGETVAVPYWRVPSGFLPRDHGETIVVDPGM